MAEPGEKKIDDWVLPTSRKFDPTKVNLESVEKHVRRGLQIVHHTDGTAEVVGQVVIKGSKNEDFDPR